MVVWSGYRAGPWAIRSLRSAGWEVLALHPDDVGGGRSTACLRPARCPSPSQASGAFVERVAAICREARVEVVLPLDEDAVRVLADAGPTLGGATVVGPDAAQYRALCDKRGLKETARAVGVGHPRSATVAADGSGADPMPPLPSVVKARVTGTVPGAGSVSVVSTPAERDAILARYRGAGVDAVVEELIQSEHWSVHCVRGGEGAFAAVTAVILRTYPRTAGMPSVFEVRPTHPAVAEAARRLLDAVDYRGPANVQLFARDGEMLVHDVNLRVPAGVAWAMRSGLDLPAAGVAAALGRTWGSRDLPTRPGLRYLSIVDELRSLGQGRRPSGATVASRGSTMLDPPLRDPLWIGEKAVDAAGRALRRGRRRAGIRRRASP